MPPRNPLRENDHPREQTKGKDILNTRSQRVARIVGQDGNVQEYIMDVHHSWLDGNGGHIDDELINVITDQAGNPLPEDPRSVIRSHSDLFITSPEQFATCTSWLHGNRHSRNILVGQDGRPLPGGGAICSRCDTWVKTIYLALGILGVGLILGIWRGAGLF
jgi:hypothetical protein